MYDPEKARKTDQLKREIKELVFVIMSPRTLDKGRECLGAMYEIKLARLRQLVPELSVNDF